VSEQQFDLIRGVEESAEGLAACEVTAPWQDGRTWTTDVWDRLAGNINGGPGYVSDAWAGTGGDTSRQIPSCAP